jgi:hypothetical protein
LIIICIVTKKEKGSIVFNRGTCGCGMKFPSFPSFPPPALLGEIPNRAFYYLCLEDFSFLPSCPLKAWKDLGKKWDLHPKE